MNASDTRRRLRILHLTTYLQGGAGRIIADLACGQRGAGHRVTVVTSACDEPGYCNYPGWIAALKTADVRLLQVDSLFKRETARLVAAFASLREVLDMSDVSIVHAHAAMPALVGMLLASRARRRVPVIQTVHGWGIAKTSDQEASDVGVMSSLDRVVPVSAALGRVLQRLGVAPDQLTVIPCGVGPAPLDAPLDDPVFAAMEDWRRAGLVVLICIGSVGARKNQRLIVDALASPVAPRGVACAFVGEGEEVASLSALVKDAGMESRVRFFGPHPDAARLLPAADWLVLPSRDEGLPLSVIEAFRAGVPALCSDIEPLRELVQPGRTGLLFQSASRESLVSALNDAATMRVADRMGMGARGRQLWEQDYQTSIMAARYDDLYRDLVAARESA